eukprot:gene6446-9867_t
MKHAGGNPAQRNQRMENGSEDTPRSAMDLLESSERALALRQEELARERKTKRQQAELREAFSDIRKVAAELTTTRSFELGHSTLPDWAEVVNTRLSIIETHVSNLITPPSPPCNTLEPPEEIKPADDLSLDKRADYAAVQPKRSMAVLPCSKQPDFDACGSPAASPSAAHPPPRVIHAGGNPAASLSAALYFLLEGITEKLRAERCVLYQYQPRTGDLSALCTVNVGSTKSSSLKVAASVGWSGQVFTSGVMANVSNALSDPNYNAKQDRKLGFRTRSLICAAVPLLGSSTKRFGVVQFANKNKGTANFNAGDESRLSYYVDLIAYLVQKYPFDAAVVYDPTPVHRAVPFRTMPPENMAIPTPEVQQLVYRSTQSGHTTPSKQQQIVVPPESSVVERQANIIEVDYYIRKIEDNWMKSVGLNVEYEKEGAQTVSRIKELRDVVLLKQRLIKDLTTELQSKDEALRNALQQQKLEPNAPPSAKDITPAMSLAASIVESTPLLTPVRPNFLPPPKKRPKASESK